MPIRETIIIDEIVDYLNELFKIDPTAIEHLLDSRVLCNKKLAEHPTCQVARNTTDGRDRVGILGVINGMLGISEKGMGTIVAYFDNYTGELKGFSRF